MWRTYTNTEWGIDKALANKQQQAAIGRLLLFLLSQLVRYIVLIFLLIDEFKVELAFFGISPNEFYPYRIAEPVDLAGTSTADLVLGGLMFEEIALDACETDHPFAERFLFLDVDTPVRRTGDDGVEFFPDIIHHVLHLLEFD
jgi:hypothetical protein